MNFRLNSNRDGDHLMIFNDLNLKKNKDSFFFHRLLRDNKPMKLIAKSWTRKNLILVKDSEYFVVSYLHGDNQFEMQTIVGSL